MWLSLLLAAPALALGPRVLTVTHEPGPCGKYALDVQARGRDLEILVDDKVRASGSGLFARTYAITGEGVPGTPVELEVRSPKGVVHSASFDVPPWEVSATLEGIDLVGPGENLAAKLAIETPCRIIKWRVHGELGTSTYNGETFSRDHRFEIVAPAEPGEVPLVVTLTTDEGGPLATVERVITVGSTDRDGDGVLSLRAGGKDCDDDDPNVSPKLSESPAVNAKDDDCDGIIDEGTVAYDDDGDGHTEEQGDCNDADPTRHPGAVEIADCQDQDCDGKVDEEAQPLGWKDPYEENATADIAHDLRTTGQRSFSRDLRMIVDGKGDEEWFRFYADDGYLDDFRVHVEALDVGVGASYTVRVGKTVGGNGQSFTRPGDYAQTSGSGLSDDSGIYYLQIRSRTDQSCPLTVRVTAF